jgi:uncharacterized protein with beta-barrel porin domain
VDTIINGDLANSGAILAGNNAIHISNASTLSGTVSNSGLVSGGNRGLWINSATSVNSISNTGTIRGANTGIAVTSTSTVSGGITNSGIIQGNIRAINVDVASNVSHIDILGQHARVIGAVDAVNSDFNIASGAVFASEGAFNVKSLNVAADAVFSLANSITAQNGVTNAGTLAIGNTMRTITSSNGYVQSAGGILQLGITNATNYGQLIANSTVDLAQSGNINVQIAANTTLHAGDTLTNIISGGTLIAPTNGFSVSDNSFIWNFNALTNTSAGVDLRATIDPMVYAACKGDYCQQAANRIISQVAAGNSAFSPYAAISSESAFKTAASQATSELSNENTQVIELITRSVLDVVPMWNSLKGKSAEDAADAQPGRLWLKPYGAAMAQNKQNTVPGFNARADGIVLGRDEQVTQDWVMGGAIAIGQDYIHSNAALSGQAINSDTYQLMLYGVKEYAHRMYLAGLGLVGYGHNRTQRAIPLYASTAKGSYHNWFTNLRAQFGYNLYASNENLLFTPALDVSYVFINQNAYHESGSAMDLSVATNNNSALVLGAYGNSTYHVTTRNQQDLTFTGYVGVASNVLTRQPQTMARFIAGGSNFTTFGIEPYRLVFRGGMGLTIANPAKPFKVKLNYDLQAGNNTTSSAGALTLLYLM